MIRYELEVTTPAGAIVARIRDYQALRYVIRADGQIGALEVTVPTTYTSLFNPNNTDYRLRVLRSINGQAGQLDGQTEYLAQKWVITTTTITVSGYSLQSLLQRRLIAYYADYGGFSKFTAQPLGDIMKALVRTNFFVGASYAIRDGDDSYVNIGSIFTVEANKGDGASIACSCSRDNLYNAITKISATSMQNNIWLVGQIISDGTNWQFRTFQNQFGIDRRTQNTLSVNSGNIENVELTYDRTTETTMIYVAGSGTGLGRLVGSAFGDSVTASPYNRKETIYNNGNVRDIATANTFAQNYARQKRAIFTMKASIVQTPTFVRGINYNVGDILNVEFQGLVYAMRLDMVDVKIENGNVVESAELRLI